MALTTIYTTVSGPGTSAPQVVPGQSLGGFASTTPWVGGVQHDLFGRASSLDVADARADVRCVYVYNGDESTDLVDVRVYLTPTTAGGAGVSVGVDPRPATYADNLSDQTVIVTSAYATPSGVTFAAPTDYATGVALGTLYAQSGRGIWLRRVPSGVAGSPSDATDLTIQYSGGSVVRQILWETEPYGQKTRPPVTPRPVPATPTPIKRLVVDFLAEGGSRVSWEIDTTFRDDGPYDFQLQTSKYGTPDATDWANAGPPSRDAQYLLDPAARLWGAAKDVFYRVLLTTQVGTYVSHSVGAFGRLAKADWLLVREILRKEELVLRRLAGMDGFLLKARRYGTRCACVDPNTFEVGNSSDPVCLGTGYSGGYLPPVALSFALPATRTKRERVAYNENVGMVLPDAMRVRMVATTPIASRDVWVSRGGDERWYVDRVEEVAAWMGVPVVYEVTIRLAPRSDVIYTFPITRPVEAVPYWLRPKTVDL